MRYLNDPVVQHSALVLYRQGHSDEEVAQVLDVPLSALQRELEIDVPFQRRVAEAQQLRFDPIVQHAVELAEQADVRGEKHGAHKALELVMRHYDKWLDRASKVDEIKLKAQAQVAVEQHRPTTSPITDAQQVDRLIQAVQDRDIVDVESKEDHPRAPSPQSSPSQVQDEVTDES